MNLFGGGVAAPQQIALFHGTSWENAQRIERDGFDLKFAHHGQLGKGVYVARHEKAYRFAENGAWHDGDEGGLIKVLVNIQNPKYVSEVQRAGHWWDEGYDACRVDSTPLSSNMEWCIRDPAQIRVLSISRVRVTSSPGAEAPPPMIIYDDDADDDNEESDEAEEGEAQHLEERAPSPQEERAPSPQSPSIGERLAGFGGDVEQLTDYHQGLIDSDGEPTEYATETGYERRDDDDDEDDDGDDESDDHGDDYSVRIGGLVEVGGDDDSEDDDIDGHDDDGEDDGGDDDSDGHDDNGDDDDGDADGHDDEREDDDGDDDGDGHDGSGHDDDGGHDDGGYDDDGYDDGGGDSDGGGGGYSDDGGGYSDDGGGGYYSSD